MSEKQKLEVAKKYIDKQIQIMKDNGCAPKTISSTQYQAMVAQVAKTILK